MELVDQLVDFLPADFLTLRFGKTIEGGQMTEWDVDKGKWVTYRVYGDGHTRIAKLAADFIKDHKHRLRGATTTMARSSTRRPCSSSGAGSASPSSSSTP